MISRHCILTFAVFVLISIAVSSHAVERVVWDKKPIPVKLGVERERMIHFPADIRYWLPEGSESVLHVLSAQGVLYLTALNPFENIRLHIQEVNSQQLYLLDVSATRDGHYEQELIVLTHSPITSTQQAQTRQPKTDWSIRLTRFAAQSLYAPERLIPADSQIRRVTVDMDKSVMLVRGGNIETTPIAAWHGGGLYITAVRLRNLSQNTLVITSKPERQDDHQTIDLATDMRGQWLTASVQHSVLAPTGQHEDRTCLYLVSEYPFEASL